MKVFSILTLGHGTAFPAVLTETVAAAFHDAIITPVPDFAAAQAQPPCGGLEFFLIGADHASPEISPEEALDEQYLPRWAVLRFDEKDGSIPVAGWTVTTLVPLLKEAAARHALSRENARHRGELLTMARRVSHDLRTPLGGIIATMDMLAETIPAAADASKPVFTSIDEITKLITRTSFLLRAIAQPLPCEPVAMGAVVRDALLRLERPIYQRQAVIHQPGTWPGVAGVASWIGIIWWNLMHNALHHAGPSPVITLGWDKIKDNYQFRIHDTGPGPAAKSADALFRSFHRLHDPDAPHGLGLPIVRRLTELQGGTCGYHPMTDGGGTFHFTLPEA